MTTLTEIQNGLSLSYGSLDAENADSATDFIYYFNLLLEDLKSSSLELSEQEKSDIRIRAETAKQDAAVALKKAADERKRDAQKKAFMVYAAIAFYWGKINNASFELAYNGNQLNLGQVLAMNPDKHLVKAVLNSGQLQQFSNYAYSDNFLANGADRDEQKQILFALMDSLLISYRSQLSEKLNFYKQCHTALTSWSELNTRRTVFYLSLPFFWLVGIPPLVAYYFYREAVNQHEGKIRAIKTKVEAENNKKALKDELSFAENNSLKVLSKGFPNRPTTLKTLVFTENLSFDKALKIQKEISAFFLTDDAYFSKIDKIKFKCNNKDYEIKRDGAGSDEFFKRFFLYVPYLADGNLREKSVRFGASQLGQVDTITAVNFSSAFRPGAGNGPFKLKGLGEEYYFSLLYQWVKESEGQVRLDYSTLSLADCQKAEAALLKMLESLEQRNKTLKGENKKPEILKLGDIVIDKMSQNDLNGLISLIKHGELDVRSVHCKGVTFKPETSFNFCLEFARAWAKDNTQKESFVEVTYNKDNNQSIGFLSKKNSSFKVDTEFTGYVFCENSREVYYCSQQQKVKIARIAQKPRCENHEIQDAKNLNHAQLEALRSEINEVRELSAENLVTGYFPDHQKISCAKAFVITKACASYKFNIANLLWGGRNSKPDIYYRTSDGFYVKLNVTGIQEPALNKKIKNCFLYDQDRGGEESRHQPEITSFESLLLNQRQGSNYCRFSLTKVESLDSFQPVAQSGVSHTLAYQTFSDDRPVNYKIFAANQAQPVASCKLPDDLAFLIHHYDHAGYNNNAVSRVALIDKLERATALSAIGHSVKLKYEFFTSFVDFDEASKCLLNYIKLNSWANIDYSDLLSTTQGIEQLLALFENKDFHNRLVFNKKVSVDGGENLVPALFVRHDGESAKDFLARVIAETGICQIEADQLGGLPSAEQAQVATPINSLYHLLHNNCRDNLSFSAQLLPLELSNSAVAAIKQKAGQVKKITIGSLESILKTPRFFELFSDSLEKITIAGFVFDRKGDEALNCFLFRACLSAPVSVDCRKRLLDYYLKNPAKVRLNELQLDTLTFKDERQFAEFIDWCVGEDASLKDQSKVFAKFNKITVENKEIALKGGDATASAIFIKLLLQFSNIDKPASDSGKPRDQASDNQKLPGQRFAAMVKFFGKDLLFDNEFFTLNEESSQLIKDSRFFALVQCVELDKQLASSIDFSELKKFS